MKVLFLDESGGHSLSLIDPQYPLFVLGGVVMEQAYSEGPLVAELNAFKMRGRHALGKPEKEDWRIVEGKFRRSPSGRLEGYGLVILPNEKAGPRYAVTSLPPLRRGRGRGSQ